MPTIKYSRTRRKNQGAFALFLFFAVEVQRCFPAAPPLSGRPASLVRPSARLPPVRMPFQHSAGAAQNTAKKNEGKGIDYFSFACYTPFTRGCSSSVELRLPKPIRWVRLPSSAPKKLSCPWHGSFFATRGVECVIAHATGHVHEPAQTLANSSILFPVPRKGNRMHATPIIRSRKAVLPLARQLQSVDKPQSMSLRAVGSDPQIAPPFKRPGGIWGCLPTARQSVLLLKNCIFKAFRMRIAPKGTKHKEDAGLRPRQCAVATP